MAPWPSSNKEPSSLRTTSKSPKTNDFGPSSVIDSSRAARIKQARHSPLEFNDWPHTEQVVTPDATDLSMASLFKLPSTHGAAHATLRPRPLRCLPFGGPQRATLDGSALAAGLHWCEGLILSCQGELPALRNSATVQRQS